MPLDKTKFKIKCELDITKTDYIWFLGYLNQDADEDEKKKSILNFPFQILKMDILIHPNKPQNFQLMV